MPGPDKLKTYSTKRNFAVTTEPARGGVANEAARSFVIQKHWATRLHYDLRLELDGTMKSWAVPKGPSLDPHDKRMAIHVEDHPISYNTFEGTIPPKQYGAGKVIIWDKGIWTPINDPYQGYQEGNLKFELHGVKLQGRWVLVRMKDKSQKQEPWLLIKEKDPMARDAQEFSIVEALPDSVSRVEAVPSTANTIAPKKLPVKKIPPQRSGINLLAGAKKSNLPEMLQPQLATLVVNPPANEEDWIYEIKFDGYRFLTRVEGNNIHLITRNGNDWTHKLPALTAAIKKLKLESGWLDGEIVVLNDKGIPDFQALQGAFDSSKTQNIIYYLFDLPFYDGFDLRAVSLIDRKELLASLLQNVTSDLIRFSDTFDVPRQNVLQSACRLGLEGVIGKRKASTYVSRRSADWIKLKCAQRQEFIICGYTDPQGSRIGIGSLVLGVHDEQGELRYSGNVGTGFNTRILAALKKKLTAIGQPQCPFKSKTGIENKPHWVTPTLVAEVSFAEWTGSGRIRHSVFHGLRADKTAREIIRETPAYLKDAKPATEKIPAKHKIRLRNTGHKDADNVAPSSSVNRGILPATMKITHPDRIIDASTQITKRELIEYYALVGPVMMEHLKGRPVSLVRAPEGVSGQLFFQKHGDSMHLPGIHPLDPALDPDHPALLEVATPEGLLSAAQMNVIEFHTWNAVKTNITKPDRMTFDLDPGEGVTWLEMQQAAKLLQAFLTELKLVAFLKTSGGKGLHLVVPIKRLHDWDTVKNFSQAIVQHVAETIPQRFSAKSGPQNRRGKIYIDYLRNGFGATTITAWSARTRPGLGVSVPVAWSELDALSSSAHWTVANIQSRLNTGNEPWKEYSKTAQSLTQAMKRMAYNPSIKLGPHRSSHSMRD